MPQPVAAACRCEPDRAGAALGRTRAMEQGDRRQTRQEADNGGDRDQAPVMLSRQAVDDPQQPVPSLNCVPSAYWLANFVLSFLNKHSRVLPVSSLAQDAPRADDVDTADRTVMITTRGC